MKNIANSIHEVIERNKPLLVDIPEDVAGKKSEAGKWSKKEILGHLIDSALNNHQRFVRAAQNVAMDYPPYNQNKWVEVQQYDNMSWSDLIELFTALNLHISRVLNNLPEDAAGNLCNVGKENPVTLEFVVKDYLRHLNHHLEKIME